MTFEKLEQIKSAVEAFPRTKFVSILENNKICIQNTDTDQIFEVEYEEGKDCGLKFNTKGKKALTAKKKKMVKGQEKINEFKENCELLRTSIKNIFAEENFQESVEALKNTIRVLPTVDIKAINEQVEDIVDSKKEKEYLPFIAEKFGEKLEAYFKEEAEFKNSLNLFDENNDLIEGEILERATIADFLKQTDEVYQKFQEDAKHFEEVKKQTAEILGSDELATKFFEGVDFSKNLRVGVTKTLVMMKQTNEAIDVKDASSKLIAILENNMLPIGGAPMPAIYNLAKDNKYTPKFLRFKMGIFSLDDVRTMINEVNEAWSRLGDYNEEDLMFMSDIKMKLEYMFNSQQLNDHLLAEIVESFNARFMKDSEKEYDDASKQLAWKDPAQMKQGNAQGIEVSAGPAKE